MRLNFGFCLYEQFKNYLVPFYGKLRANLKNFFLNQVNEKNPKISRFISKNELKEKINFLNSSKKKINVIEVTKNVFEIDKI